MINGIKKLKNEKSLTTTEEETLNSLAIENKNKIIDYDKKIEYFNNKIKEFDKKIIDLKAEIKKERNQLAFKALPQLTEDVKQLTKTENQSVVNLEIEEIIMNNN